MAHAIDRRGAVGIAFEESRLHGDRMPSQQVFDPEAFRMWSLVREQHVTSMRILAANDSPKPAVQSSHLHPVPTLAVCLLGVVRIEVWAAKPIDLNAGEGLVIAPGAWHWHAPVRTGCAAYQQGILHTASDVVLSSPERTWWLRTPLEPNNTLIRSLLTVSPSERCLIVEDLFARFTSEMIAPLAAMHPAVKLMADFYWNQLHLPISAADILKASGVGPSHAHALFQEYFGETPKQALLRSRLGLAQQLLQENVPIIDAAARCGFMNRADLTRAFSRAFKMSPSVWIKQHAKPTDKTQRFTRR